MNDQGIHTLNVGGRLIDLSIPKVMGILNVTPDSFYDGQRYQTPEQALRQAEKMISEGADFIDIGGYSSRPGASDISEADELSRVLPVIRQIVKQFPEINLSIDTFRSEVARQALEEGANLVNDISGGDRDDRMTRLVAERQVPYVMMHMRGTPQNMNQLTDYSQLTKEIIDSLHPKIYHFKQLGIKDLVVDPGFGFAKTVPQNFELLNNLESLSILNRPILVGLSRKSMIWRTLNIKPEEALNGTTTLHTIALLKGASILRVHDVAEAKQCIALVSQLGTRND
jgi:dihydropteroate synthase